MSIHFYKKGDTCHALFALSDEAYDLLVDSIFALQAKTGIYIDQNGKTILYPDNLKLWYGIIRQQRPGKQTELIERILQQLRQLYEMDEVIQAIGD